MDSEFLRTPKLGIEFFQSGKRCPIYSSDEDNNRYTVVMSPKPFELRFPHIEDFKAVQICGSLDQSIYDPNNYIFEEFFPDVRRYFWPGTGLADTIFSTAKLYLGTEKHNYLDVDGRLVRDGNYGKMVYRNFYTDQVKKFTDGLKIYLAIGLATSNPIRKEIEEIILDFRENDEPLLSKPDSKQFNKKTLKIFIASSYELKEERDKIENHIGTKNKILNKKNIFIETLIWEDLDDSVSLSRKQDDYNNVILEADLMLCLFFTKAGKFTIEEFNVAYRNFLGHGRPKIYTYFKDAAIDINKISSKDLIAKEAFLEYLKEIQHHPSYYKNIDSLINAFDNKIDEYLNKHIFF